MLKEALAAFCDEAVALRRDPGALVVLVGAVVLYAVVYPVPYRSEVLKEVPVAVVDLDHSSLSRRLTTMVDAHELLKVAEQSASLGEAERLVREGRVGAILVVPEDLERSVLRGRQATVVAFVDAAYFLIYRQALTGLLESTGTLSAGVEIRRLQAQGYSFEHAKAARDPMPVITRPLFNPAEGYATYVVPSVFVLILQQTLLVGVGLLGGTSREGGHVPTPRSSALASVAGRAGLYLALYSLHALLYLAVLPMAHGFPQRGSALAVAVFVLPFLLSSIFLALALAPHFSTREASIQLLVATSLPALFLAGFSWPVEAMPGLLHPLALLLPSTAGINGLLRINAMGADLGHVRSEWWVLWALTGLYFLLAWRAERRGRRVAPCPVVAGAGGR